MKKVNKIIPVVLTLALAASVGSLGMFAGCGGGGDVVVSGDTYKPVNHSEGNTYYAAPDVVRGQGDGSYENPYNLYSILSDYSSSKMLQPGDTLLVKPGVYEPYDEAQAATATETTGLDIVIRASGTYDNYITVMNAAYANDGHKYSSDKAVLSFYNNYFNGNLRGVQIYGNYWYWYGVDVCGAGDNGLYIGGSYNIIENCEFYNNRDTGLQLGRADGSMSDISQWPSYNLIKNCTSYNNYDNETYGENADGFGAKLTIGYGNIFDGCISYRNSDDGWDLYAKADTGNIGCVIIYNCLAFENGYLMESQQICNARFVDSNGAATYDKTFDESDTSLYSTRDGDGNGFKLGGGVNEGDVILYNCMTFNNKMHGVTDNSNPGTLMIENVTSYNNGAAINKTKSANNFGAIDYSGSTDSCNNIDVARWDYSYNIVSGVLSVINGNGNTGKDEYRGAVTNSMFTRSGGYYVTDPIDADTYAGDPVGTSYTAAAAADIFEALPSLTLGVDCGEYDSATCTYGNTIHSQLRNADGSINTGDMLKIKDPDSLQVPGVGCDLSKENWSEYTHYEYNALTDFYSAADAEAAMVSHLIYVPVDTDAVFQNFKVVNSILGNDISWTSSDASVLSIGYQIDTTVSNSTSRNVTVYRDATKDVEVTLTAHVDLASGGTVDKDFVLTIKKDNPSIGSIVVEDVEDDTIIVDQYSIYTEPAVSVENGADYNGKLLDSSLYDIETVYSYSDTGAAGTFGEVGSFTSSRAGVYNITKNVTLKSDKTKTGSYTYTIYVASASAPADLDGSFEDYDVSSIITVNRDGFILESGLTNVTGHIYVQTSSTKIESPTAEGVISSEGVIDNEFRATGLSLQYENANTDEYYIYLVLTSKDGTAMSDVYSAHVEVQSISDIAGFNAMLASSNSTTIYRLENDLDFGADGATLQSSQSTFTGLFNGMGHTIKNLSTEQRAIFLNVKGGTIENVKFDNIMIDSADDGSGVDHVAGIIGAMYGGYIYNVAITNLRVAANTQRIGGLIGEVTISSGGNEGITYIDNVSLVNDYSQTMTVTEEDEDGNEITTEDVKYKISGTERIGGIVGFVQAGLADSWNKLYITNCYVNAYITATSGVAGSIVGRSDDRNAKDYLEITNCYTTGIVESTNSGTSRVAGILGYFSGSGVTRIENCVTTVELWFGGESLGASIKNASWIVGGFSATADSDVIKCYAPYGEYNEAYDVSVEIGVELYRTSASWWQGISFDLTDWTLVTSENDESVVEAPYITLNFLGSWEA